MTVNKTINLYKELF